MDLLDILIGGTADHQAHDAGLHHLPQIHEIIVAVSLIQNDAVEHGIDEGLGETGTHEGALGTPDLQHAHINKDLDGFPHRIAGNAQNLRQLGLRGDLIPGKQLLADDGVGDIVHGLLHHGTAVDLMVLIGFHEGNLHSILINCVQCSNTPGVMSRQVHVPEVEITGYLRFDRLSKMSKNREKPLWKSQNNCGMCKNHLDLRSVYHKMKARYNVQRWTLKQMEG